MPLKPRSAILLTCPVISPESKSIVPKPTRESSFFIAPASQLMQSPGMLYSLYCDGNGAKQTARSIEHSSMSFLSESIPQPGLASSGKTWAWFAKI